MKKIITKHFYKIILLSIILFFILIISLNSIILNVIFLVFIFFIIFLLYYIRKRELNKIAQKFTIQEHYIEEKENRYMSEKELSALYNKIYDEHFNS